jgi:hypothetical protein
MRTRKTRIREPAQASSCWGLKGTVAKLYTNTDKVAIGSLIPFGQKLEKRAVKIKGAVSPAARAIAKVTPVRIEGKAAGKTINKTVW